MRNDENTIPGKMWNDEKEEMGYTRDKQTQLQCLSFRITNSDEREGWDLSDVNVLICIILFFS